MQETTTKHKPNVIIHHNSPLPKLIFLLLIGHLLRKTHYKYLQCFILILLLLSRLPHMLTARLRPIPIPTSTMKGNRGKAIDSTKLDVAGDNMGKTTAAPSDHRHYLHTTSHHHQAQSKHSILIPSPLNALLHSDRHMKYHFYNLGGDFIRVSAYRRFKQLFRIGGGSLIKEIVFDLSTF